MTQNLFGIRSEALIGRRSRFIVLAIVYGRPFVSKLWHDIRAIFFPRILAIIPATRYRCVFFATYTWVLSCFVGFLSPSIWPFSYKHAYISAQKSPYTAISRKVVAKTVHATIPKGNMGYDQYTCSWHCSCRTFFCYFPLALANIRPWPLLPFFEICLKNSELKTTYNTFRDCRVHFFRQPGRKKLRRWNERGRAI